MNWALLGWVLLIALFAFGAGIVATIRNVSTRMHHTDGFWEGFFTTAPETTHDKIVATLMAHSDDKRIFRFAQLFIDEGLRRGFYVPTGATYEQATHAGPWKGERCCSRDASVECVNCGAAVGQFCKEDCERTQP